MRAVVPAAGEGTRMRVITGGAPKELLPLGDRTVLDRVVDEALSAGAEQVVVVGSPAKPEIAECIRSRGDARLVVVEQDQPLGFAHAVACAGASDLPTLVLVADALVMGSMSQRLANEMKFDAWAAVGVRKVPKEHQRRYGIVEWDPRTSVVNALFEKPEPGLTRSLWAVSSRWALSPTAFEELLDMVRRFRNPQDLSVTDLLADGVDREELVLAVPKLEDETSLDCGSPDGYREAKKVFG